MSLGYHNICCPTQRRLAQSQPWVYNAETERRFWAKVDRQAGEVCWLWQANTVGRDGDKYGQFNTGRVAGKQRNVYAHRFAWLLTHGQIPAGLHVCHHCDTPLCVNPSHLFLGTQGENLQDASRKGRLQRGSRTTAAFDLATRLAIFYQPGYRGIGADLARKYGVTKTAIYHIRDGHFIGAPPFERVRTVQLPILGDVR